MKTDEQSDARERRSQADLQWKINRRRPVIGDVLPLNRREIMTSKRWYISTDEFAAAVREVDMAPVFERDETVHTWCASFFRFVHARIDRFPDIICFAAAAIYSTPMPLRSIVQWANEVAIFPVDENRVMDVMNAAREDCADTLAECDGIPDWLSFDGDVIDAFDLNDRGGPLVAIASHHVYRTSKSYYYICINRES